MQKKYPFKFLDSYQRKDKDFFFGRSDEIELLYQMIFQTRILLIYGTSGTGKTSLIQCGLANKFQTYDWLALYIRRGGNLLSSMDKTLCRESDEAFTYEEQKDPAIKNLTAKVAAVYKASFKPVYLIFDQFEELYLLGTKAEQQHFIRAIQEILSVEQPVKIILSIREEYLGYLYEFERIVPELLRKKLRVEAMNLDKVKSVIKNIGQSPNSLVSLEAGAEDEVADGIFEKIRGDENILSIQLPYLQVFLDKLFLKITGDEARKTEAVFTQEALEKMGNIGDVLRNFLDEQVLMAATKLEQKPETIWKILSPFVTLDGTKQPLSAEQLKERLPDEPATLISEALQAFVKSRILRYTEKDQLYEIAHDSLAKQVNEKRSDEEIAILEVQRLIKNQVSVKAEAREYFTEKQLLFIEPYMGKIKLANEEKVLIQQSHEAVIKQKGLEKERQEAEKKNLLERQQILEKSQRNQRRFLRWIAAALVLVIGLAGWALYQQQDASKNAKKALASEKTAKDALEENKKQQAISKARELKAFGDSYLALGDSTFACDSYSKGLVALDSVPKPSKESLPILKELTDLKRKLKCE